jgi:hypothetical protein
MAKQDVVKAINELRGAYPYYTPPDKESLIGLWMRHLGTIPGDVLMKAVDLHINRSKFFPGINEIRSVIEEAEYLAGNEQAAVNLDDLRWQFKALEDAYYHDGVFNHQEWVTLERTFHKFGYEARAEHTRRKRESIEADVQNSREAEMGMVQRV